MCIDTFEDFIKMNTFFLSPSTLAKYLNIEFPNTVKENENLEDLEIFYKKFLFDISQVENSRQLMELLKSNVEYIDKFIKFTIFSYEKLGRLLLFLDYEYNLGNIAIFSPLGNLIEQCKGRSKRLPKTSNLIKQKLDECKSLISLLLAKSFFSELVSYLERNIHDNSDLFPYILSEIKFNYEETSKGLRILLSLVKNDNKQLNILSNYLGEIYTILNRGTQKAYAGYDYEKILLIFLQKNGVVAEITKSKTKEEEDEIENLCRNWDIYIPTKRNPKIIIEVMYNLTTSSGQSDKIQEIKKCYSEMKWQDIQVITVMDGAGWIARTSDARELIESKIPVFTFNKDCLENLVIYIRNYFGMV